MDAEAETRLESFLVQLQSEIGVLDRIVHKNKNQHRRSSYFQYLMKVRRDCKLLQSSNLEELVNSCFLVINGNRPKQKVHLLESLKRRKSDGGKHNFLMRLQGALRLLSQMVDPMLKAAIEISRLLARSFFVGFCMTVLALLARLRVLTQQILVDVVSVYNVVFSLSRKQQSIKLNHEGIEVFREYYPANGEEAVFLECVWETDKFILLERKNEPEKKVREIKEDEIRVEYQSIETILGVVDKAPEEDTATNNVSSMEGVSKQAEDEPSSNKVEDEEISKIPELKKKVAFISVKGPLPSKSNETVLPIDKMNSVPLFSLLTE